jgi:DNA-binding NtrC family response regulator
MILEAVNGLDLAKRVVKQHPTCSVILVAGSVSGELIQEAQALGFDFYHKPVQPRFLINRVEELLSKMG